MAKKTTLLSQGNWYKGNLHCHSNLSDGKLSPPELASLYQGLGFDFLAITDHRRYGIHADLCREDFLIVPGVELDVIPPAREGFCHHIVGIGLPGQNHFSHGHTFKYGDECSVYDLIRLLRENGNLCFYAHPAWSHTSQEALDTIEGLMGLEIYNYGCDVEAACGLSDTWYDRQLWQGRRLNCLATDDSHQKGSQPDYGRGFIMVKARELTEAALFESILSGSFYASMGPMLEDFHVEGQHIVIRCTPCRTIGLLADSHHGQAVSREDPADLTDAVFKLTGKETYIRAVCTDQEGRQAWSQPIWLDQ